MKEVVKNYRYGVFSCFMKLEYCIYFFFLKQQLVYQGCLILIQVGNVYVFFKRLNKWSKNENMVLQFSNNRGGFYIN